jgi:hypothetical protein
MPSKTVKLKIHVSAVSSLGVVLLFILGSAGCASFSNHAVVRNDTQCLTGEDLRNSREGLAQYRSLGFPRGSAVSPLGDAPGEKDLEMMREFSGERPLSHQ